MRVPCIESWSENKGLYHVHVQWPSTATYMIHSLWLSLALLLAASGAQYPALPPIPNFCHETSSSNKKTWPWWILSKKASCNGNKGNPKKNQTRKRILPHKVQSMDSPGCRADNIQSYCAQIESIQCHIFTWSKKSIQNWHPDVWHILQLHWWDKTWRDSITYLSVRN